MDENLAIREAAIRHCRLLSLRWGEAVPYEELAKGFPYGGGRIKLVGPQGVFKPKEMNDGALTLLSTLASTYEDEHLDGDEVLCFRVSFTSAGTPRLPCVTVAKPSRLKKAADPEFQGQASSAVQPRRRARRDASTTRSPPTPRRRQSGST